MPRFRPAHGETVASIVAREGWEGFRRREHEALCAARRVRQVVSTGGDAAWIASGLPEIALVDADLTLHGLRLVGNLHAPSP